MLKFSTSAHLAGILLVATAILPAQSRHQMISDLLSGGPVDSVDADSVQSLELELAAEPENLIARTELVLYYAGRGKDELGSAEANRRRFSHVLWVVQHHPEWGLAGARQAVPDESEGDAFARISAAWEQQIAQSPDNTAVLLNAGRFFANRNFFRAEALLQKAVRLDPSLTAAREELGILYGKAMTTARIFDPRHPLDVVVNRNSAFALEAGQELDSSTDALLLGSAAATMIESGDAYYRRGEIDPDFDKPAESLLRRAISLSDQPAEWERNLARLRHLRRFRERIVLGEAGAAKSVEARSLLTGAAGDEALPQPPPGVGRVLVPALRMDTYLKRMALPDYPVPASIAGVQGKVVFHALIGTDGSVRALQLMRGHPALVEAAREAARQYRFAALKPIFGDVEVLTTIEIEFQGT